MDHYVYSFSTPFAQKVYFYVLISNYFLENSIEFISTQRGKRSAVYQGHTFVQMTSKTRWYCSKGRGDCKAILILTEDGKFIKLLNSHDHPAPKLVRMLTGEIVRL